MTFCVAEPQQTENLGMFYYIWINSKNPIIRGNSFVVDKAWSEYAVFIIYINGIFPFADKL